MSTHGIPNLTGAQWRKSSYSNGNGGDCVEVADLPRGRAVRDSKNPTGPALTVTATAWRVFTTAARSGEFD
ncbi:MAG: hypothetical protein QOG46_428 [Pseudonocardiales bacterium]|jgi:hypothetical protein|nr:hypothetical protein [Pseudonocardiales bacterium]